MLNDDSIHLHYGMHIWRFITYNWRPWWIDSIKVKYPFIFEDISLDSPTPIFKDKTSDISKWNADINSFLLSRLASTSNTFLYPGIMCPWGCSEFQHKVGNLPLDIVYQRYLPRCKLKLISSPDH